MPSLRVRCPLVPGPLHVNAVAGRPRNPRIPTVRFDIQTAFRTRMNYFNSGITGSGRVGCSGMLLSFVTRLQDDTKDSSNQSTESPILMPHLELGFMPA